MNASASRGWLLEVLWSWDPIGIGEFRYEASTEYDDLCSRILSILKNGGTPEEVEAVSLEYLKDLGVNPVGVDGFMQRIRDSY